MKLKINKKILVALIIFAFLAVAVGISYQQRLKQKEFQNRIAAYLQDNSKTFNGDYSILVKDLNDSLTYSDYHDKQKFAAASLIKLPLMLAVLVAVDQDRLSLEDKFTIDAGDITGGSGVLRYQSTPQEVSLKHLLKLMITVSDNTAANKIIEILGLNYINNVFASFGLNDTILQRRIMDFSARSDGVENYISCRDLVYLFDNIYRGQLINKNYSELMLSLLLQQKVNDRIPRFLPKDVKVAHKTGLERTVVGDAGIVFAGNCDYSLCVLTSKFRSYSQAKKFIAQISKDVYKFITENTINNK